MLRDALDDFHQCLTHYRTEGIKQWGYPRVSLTTLRTSLVHQSATATEV